MNHLMEAVDQLEELEALIQKEEALLLYFSSEHCAVCKVLKPKVAALLAEEYPAMTMRYVDTQQSPLLAGQHRIFSIPTILVFFQGREHTRLSRNIALFQLEEAIARPYSLLFED